MTKFECECDQPVALPHDDGSRCTAPATQPSNTLSALAWVLTAIAAFLAGYLFFS